MYTVKGKSNKDYLLTEHIPLVKRLAHHMKAKLPPSVEVDDLIQAGMIGLLDAISRYEETHGAQFETYAVLRIRGAMLDELRTSDWLPRSMRQNMRKIEEAMSILQQRLGHPPTESEVAKLLKMSLADYQEMLGDGGGHQLVYYEDFHDPDGNDSFLDRHCVDEDSDPLRSLLDTDFRQSVIDAIDALPPREKILMGLYYEEELNLKEIGAVMGVSESRVSQLHTQAVARLRATLRGAGVDWSSIIGLALALAGLLVGQALEGGKMASLLQPAAFAIVIVGTFGAVLLQTRLRTFVRGLEMLRWVFLPPADTRAALARDIGQWSLTARRDGTLALERLMENTGDRFNAKGLRMIVDGIAPDKLRQLLDVEITAYEMAERQAVKVWESAAGYSPTIGILGAVLGLIHVMENLTDPSKLGSGIAVAFVSTIYGVGLANLLFLPVANKLKAIVTRRVLQYEITAAVLYDIATGDHTRIIEERVASLLHEH